MAPTAMIRDFDPAILPGWADARLAVRVSWSADIFVIDGNPHTFRGLVRLYDPAQDLSLSVRPQEISEATDFARGWLEGFLHGNEPDPSPSSDVDDLRGACERAFFHEHQRVLPVERRGDHTVSVARADWSAPPASLYTHLATACAALAAKYPVWQGPWTPVSQIPVPDFDLSTADAIASAFRLMNAPAEFHPDVIGTPVLDVINAEPIEPYPAGGLEIRVRMGMVGGLVSDYSMVINLDTVDASTPTLAAHIGDILDVFVTHLDPDTASASRGQALREADAFVIAAISEQAEANPAMIAGWLTYIAARLRPDLDGLVGLPIDLRSHTNGTVIEHRSGITGFSLSDADEIGHRLRPPESR